MTEVHSSSRREASTDGVMSRQQDSRACALHMQTPPWLRTVTVLQHYARCFPKVHVCNVLRVPSAFVFITLSALTCV